VAERSEQRAAMAAHGAATPRRAAWLATKADRANKAATAKVGRCRLTL